MKYTLNGRKITKKEAYNRIRELIPNGGTQYLDNIISAGKKNEADSVTIHVGTKSTLVIEF